MNNNAETQSDQPTTPAADTTQIPDQPGPVITPAKPEKPQLSRARRFFRKVLIVLVVLGITYVAGIATDHYLRYKPLSEDLSKAQTTIDQANQDISDLQEQIGKLNTQFQEANNKVISLDSESNTLKTDAEMTGAHLELLQMLVDVSNARVALYQKDIKGAKAALVNTQQRLDDLLPLMAKFDPNLKESMPQRLSLIVSGLDRDSETARIDLELFAKDVVIIEAKMFGN
jgi:cell division protein FtsB